jgi:hypothetical protein
LCCPTNRWQVTWRDSDTEALNACFAQEAQLFSALRHFMLAKNYAAPEAASEGYAPFYMREIDHLIPSGQGQIDEIRCHAKLCKRNLAQKPVLATWDIRSKNGCFCFSFLRFLEAVACTDEGIQEHFVCLHP